MTVLILDGETVRTEARVPREVVLYITLAAAAIVAGGKRITSPKALANAIYRRVSRPEGREAARVEMARWGRAWRAEEPRVEAAREALWAAGGAARVALASLLGDECELWGDDHEMRRACGRAVLDLHRSAVRAGLADDLPPAGQLRPPILANDDIPAWAVF